jgi:nicotinate-nucleotide adenylyltransferase
LDTGLFGGTFDPIHNAHLAVARAAREAFALSRVLLVPAAVPPHKLGRLPERWDHRFRMVELACAGEQALEASDLESGSSRSYSIETIERLKAGMAPADRLFFIIGADAFDEVQTWHRWRDVVAAVEFIVVTRPGHDYAIPEGARVRPLGSVNMTVSSSQIRQMLARRQQPEELPPAVFDYIREHGLYGFGSACRGLLSR